jgi:predicted MFS family arabinose efflux permease
VEALLTLSVLMLAAFLYFETRAVEPLIPLSLFKNPVIAICSVAVFTLGMGMFGVIIYLPLFMQGVLGVSATQSGSLLTPMMLGAVVGSTITGQTTARLGTYRPTAIIGSILVAAGMIVFAGMDGSTERSQVVLGMILAGLGMGMLNPVYTVAVQNAAPRNYMGAATASTTFFRSIGATVGVAIFGTMLLTKYHREFDASVPAATPAAALVPFSNPLMLQQMRPQLDAMFARVPGGAGILHTLFASVRNALIHGLHVIFLCSAVLMSLSILLHLVLRSVPLQGRKRAPETEPALH